MLETELFAFLERTSDAAFAVTEQGEICSWNKSAERMFGYPAAEALNRTCIELLDGFGALETQVCTGECSIQRCAAQHLEIPDFDLKVTTRSGERLWVNVSTIVFDEPRRSRRLIVHLARDISHRKRNEELLAQMMELSRQLVAAPVEVNGKAPVVPLSDQERRILRLFANGKNSAVIARDLGITQHQRKTQNA
jgi:PAS domain S-box-containing protein